MAVVAVVLSGVAWSAVAMSQAAQFAVAGLQAAADRP